MNFNRYSQYAPLITRLALGSVFIWFGINQLIRPDYFVGYLPAFISISNPLLLIILNGIADTVLGLLLAIGFYTRLVALLMVFHLLGIIIGLGYNDIAVRDAGLMLIAFGQFIGGADKWCLDRRKV